MERPAGNRASTPAPYAAAVRLAPDQFAALFDQSFRTLWLVAIAITRDSALAEDVVQDAAIVALGKLDQFDPATNFTAWMSQLVRYVALNMKRKERIRRVTPLDAAGARLESRESASPSAPGMELRAASAIDVDQTHFDDAIVAGLSSLSEIARTCLLLRTIGDHPYSEIAQILAIPEGTAMSHVHRSRQILRERVLGFEQARDAGRGGSA